MRLKIYIACISALLLASCTNEVEKTVPEYAQAYEYAHKLTHTLFSKTEMKNDPLEELINKFVQKADEDMLNRKMEQHGKAAECVLEDLGMLAKISEAGREVFTASNLRSNLAEKWARRYSANELFHMHNYLSNPVAKRLDGIIKKGAYNSPSELFDDLLSKGVFTKEEVLFIKYNLNRPTLHLLKHRKQDIKDVFEELFVEAKKLQSARSSIFVRNHRAEMTKCYILHKNGK